MDFELNEEQLQVKMSVREFAEGEIAAHVREWDEKQHFPVELVPKLAAQGRANVGRDGGRGGGDPRGQGQPQAGSKKRRGGHGGRRG